MSQYLNGRIPLNMQALAKFAQVLEFDPAEVSPRLFGSMKTLPRSKDESNVLYLASTKDSGSLRETMAPIEGLQVSQRGEAVVTELSADLMKRAGLSIGDVLKVM